MSSIFTLELMQRLAIAVLDFGSSRSHQKGTYVCMHVCKLRYTYLFVHCRQKGEVGIIEM